MARQNQQATAGQAGLKQACFAHAGLTGQQNNPACASVGRGKHLIQCGLLALAPNQIKVSHCYAALLAPAD